MTAYGDKLIDCHNLSNQISVVTVRYCVTRTTAGTRRFPPGPPLSGGPDQLNLSLPVRVLQAVLYSVACKTNGLSLARLPTSRVPTAGWRVPRYATLWVTVGNPIGPCSVGHGFEVIARPMAKSKGDRVGDALCFHLASFESPACKARASDRLGVTPVGPR
mgnify:CR=1 FL=1